MPEVPWRTIMRDHPGAHLVIGVIPPSAPTDGLHSGAKVRLALVARLVGALRLSGMYALTDILKPAGNQILVALAIDSDAMKFAAAVGASGMVRSSGWASQRGFRFDDEIADRISETLRQLATPPARQPGKRPTHSAL